MNALLLLATMFFTAVLLARTRIPKARAFLVRAIGVAASSLALGACNLVDTLGSATIQAVAAIDRAVASINANSQNLTAALQQLQHDLPAQIQSTLRVEVDQVTTRAIATTGVEVRCTIEFVAGRTVLALNEIRASLLGDPRPQPLPPAICNVSPSLLDLGLTAERRQTIEWFGYGLDMCLAPGHACSLVVVEEGCEIPVPESYVARVSPYHWTVNLLETNGLVFGPRAQKMRLSYDGTLLAEAAVGQRPPPGTLQAERTLPVPAISVFPSLVRGDGETNGNPEVTASASLSFSSASIGARVCLTVAEPRPDFTRLEGCTSVTLYTAPAGTRILRINSRASWSSSYTDGDTDDDRIDGGPGELVQQALITADTRGDEVGRSVARFYFNEVRFQVAYTQASAPTPARPPLTCSAPR